jgi:hydrogenase maturation protein HypF
VGFTREVTFEGQAAMWLEGVAARVSTADAYPFPFSGDELDFRSLLAGVIRDRVLGRDDGEIARAFQRGIASGLCEAIATLCRALAVDTIELSGGVLQNELLLYNLKRFLDPECLKIWTNHEVPSSDGGISLGQAALAALSSPDSRVALAESDSARMTRVA